MSHMALGNCWKVLGQKSSFSVRVCEVISDQPMGPARCVSSPPQPSVEA